MDLVYINKNSLSKELCVDIINLFENDPKCYSGVTHSGLNPMIKDTTDLIITRSGPQWKKMNKVLTKELKMNVEKYISTFENKIDHTYKWCSSNLTTDAMQMQKYDKNKGKYVYHQDYSCDWKNKKMRKLTFLWYINDVEEGGETEFFGNHKIKPEAGKLILFPASWTCPHRGKMPISDDKYIITGWLWEHCD